MPMPMPSAGPPKRPRRHSSAPQAPYTVGTYLALDPPLQRPDRRCYSVRGPLEAPPEHRWSSALPPAFSGPGTSGAQTSSRNPLAHANQRQRDAMRLQSRASPRFVFLGLFFSPFSARLNTASTRALVSLSHPSQPLEPTSGLCVCACVWCMCVQNGSRCPSHSFLSSSLPILFLPCRSSRPPFGRPRIKYIQNKTPIQNRR
ncbi:hypothetical protein J3F83DRAFT_751643 [Trichoderma novae-zelandiae]